MNKIKLYDKEFQISIHSDKIQSVVHHLANQISDDFRDKEIPVFLSILNGAFMFTADLFKYLTIDGYLTFVKFASYRGTSSSGEVKELIGLNEDMEGRNVIELEDIVDSGLTIKQLTRQLESLHLNEYRIASFLHKPDACEEDIKLDYVGMEIPNDFIVGYGLDYDGLGRNYKDIYTLISE